MRARDWTEHQDQHGQPKQGCGAVLKQLDADVVRGQLLRGDTGTHDDRHQQSGAEELGHQAPPQSTHGRLPPCWFAHLAILTAQTHSVSIESMDAERTTDLQRRAAKHAALSDPGRLAIIETLSLGDASPTELQAMLGVSSNLLAHHLKVLQTEGLLIRTRSEADRRRTYLQLVHAALEGIVPGTKTSVARIVFVCTANSARSHLAAALWRRASDVPVASAGTHPAARTEPGAVAVAHRHNMPLRTARPRHLADVLRKDDYVITVCDNAHEELAARSDLHWSVPDPVRTGTDAAFDAAFGELTRRVRDLAPRLIAC